MLIMGRVINTRHTDTQNADGGHTLLRSLSFHASSRPSAHPILVEVIAQDHFQGISSLWPSREVIRFSVLQGHCDLSYSPAGHHSRICTLIMTEICPNVLQEKRMK